MELMGVCCASDASDSDFGMLSSDRDNFANGNDGSGMEGTT
jgi:hypothetical protein